MPPIRRVTRSRWAPCDGALGALAERLRDRPSLTLGIARTQILIDGVGTDAAHPVLRELAQRLYRRQIGGIEFSRGVEAGELSEFLIYVNGRADDAAPDAAPPQWPHIRRRGARVRSPAARR